MTSFSHKILAASIAAVSLAGCNDIRFIGGSGVSETKSSPTTSPSPAVVPPEDAVSLTAACKDPSKVEVISHVLDFGERRKGSNCPWGVGNNLQKISSAMTARVEKSVQIEVNPERQVCQIKFRSQTDKITYDDALFLLLDEYEIVSTWASFSSHFEVTDGLRVWDWERIKGKIYDLSGNSVICLGNSDQCIAPRTEVSGPFHVNLSVEDSIVLARKILGQAVWNFRLVVTGDNNEDLDCSHSPIAFDLELVVLKN